MDEVVVLALVLLELRAGIARQVRNHITRVAALTAVFCLHDDPPLTVPALGRIHRLAEQPLLLTCCFILCFSFCHEIGGDRVDTLVLC